MLDEIADGFDDDVLRRHRPDRRPRLRHGRLLRACSASTPSRSGRAVPVEVELAHEFRYRDPVLGPNTLVVSISQSGETMDTLMAVKYAARARRPHALDLQHAGRHHPPRVRRRALHARRPGGRGRVDEGVHRPGRRALPVRPAPRRGCAARSRDDADPRRSSPSCRRCPTKLQEVLECRAPRSRELARQMSDTRSVLFLGRHVGYPVALEGALKLKELAYIHAEGFAAGELKHGPIALIEPGQRVFVIVPSPRDSVEPAPQGGLEHPGDPCARRARARDRRGWRRRGPAVRRRGDPHPARRPDVRAAARGRAAAASSRWSSPRRRGSTWTSRATWRSPSPSSERARMILGIGVDVVDIARFARSLERTPPLRGAAVRTQRAGPAAVLPRRPVRGEGGADQGLRGLERASPGTTWS